MALCRLVEMRLRYMRQKVEGRMRKGIEEVGPDCCDNIIKTVSRMRKVTEDEPAGIQEQVGSSLLQDHQQKLILEVIDKKVETGVGCSTNKTELRFPDRY